MDKTSNAWKSDTVLILQENPRQLHMLIKILSAGKHFLFIERNKWNLQLDCARNVQSFERKSNRYVVISNLGYKG
jgi:hypothetical protein